MCLFGFSKMNKPAICGVSLAGSNVLLWRCRNPKGGYRNMLLSETQVSTYVETELGFKSTQALKSVLENSQSCSLYYNEELVAIYNYDILTQRFDYFKNVKVHSVDDLDKVLDLSLAEKNKWNMGDIRIVCNALVSNNYSHVVNKLTFENFDFAAMIMEKLGANSDCLNPLIVRRDVIARMVNVFAKLGAVKSYADKCVSNVCKVALNEVLRLRSTKKREQRDYLYAHFNLVNANIAFSAANYEDVIMIHFKLRGMTSQNVESVCQAISIGGADALKHFCKLLSGAIRKHQLMYSHQRLDYGPRKVLKHIFAKHGGLFDALIFGKTIVYETQLTLLLVKLNYAFYAQDSAFNIDIMFVSVVQFVDHHSMVADSMMPIIRYVMKAWPHGKTSDSCKKCIGNMVKTHADVLLLNHNFVPSWFDFCMRVFGHETTVQQWEDCKLEFKSTEEHFDHALALTKWFCFSQAKAFPPTMVTWWQSTIEVPQWKVPVLKSQ